MDYFLLFYGKSISSQLLKLPVTFLVSMLFHYEWAIYRWKKINSSQLSFMTHIFEKVLSNGHFSEKILDFYFISSRVKGISKTLPIIFFEPHKWSHMFLCKRMKIILRIFLLKLICLLLIFGKESFLKYTKSKANAKKYRKRCKFVI